MRTFPLGLIIILCAGNPRAVDASELFVAVSPQQLEQATRFLNLVNEHEAMSGVGISLVAVADSDIPMLSGVSSYLRESGYSFLLSAHLGDLLETVDADFTYTALLTQTPAIATLKQQIAINYSVYGDIVAAELGRVDLISLAEWTTPPSVLLSQFVYSDSTSLEGQRVIVNSDRAFAAMEQVGAQAINLPAGEQYQAFLHLETSAADAVIASQEVAAEMIAFFSGGSAFTGVDVPQGYMLAELNSWLELRESERQAIRVATREVAQIEMNYQLEIESKYLEISRELDLIPTGFKSIIGEMTPIDEVFSTWQEQYGDQGSAAIELFQKVIEIHESPTPNYAEEEESLLNPKFDPIAFVTNRVDEGGNDLSIRFGASRGAGAGLTCGLINPLTPRTGRFGEPYGGRLESVSNSEARGATDCIQMIHEWLGEEKQLVIFLHGYKNTFDSALRRALAYKFDVADDLRLLVWSWPSLGDRSGYIYDLKSVSFSRRDIESFANSLVQAELEVSTIVLAHSMGSMVAMDLAEYVFRAGGSIDGIYLIAPDIPETLFDSFLIDFGNSGSGKVLYANGLDIALEISKIVNRERPIGLGGAGRYIADGIETIDVTEIAATMAHLKSHHSHAFEIPVIARDLIRAIRTGESASGRGLTEIVQRSGVFYLVRK